MLNRADALTVRATVGVAFGGQRAEMQDSACERASCSGVSSRGRERRGGDGSGGDLAGTQPSLHRLVFQVTVLVLVGVFSLEWGETRQDSVAVPDKVFLSGPSRRAEQGPTRRYRW